VYNLNYYLILVVKYRREVFTNKKITRKEKPTDKQMDRDPKKILDERLARGEITSEEHEELKEKLE